MIASAYTYNYVIVTVTDTGTGMSEDVIGKMFKPFFTTKPIGHRAGLGRSMLSLPTTRCRSGFLHG
jgi:signal transduction histidine kinase